MNDQPEEQVSEEESEKGSSYEHASHWADVFLDEFSKESDRAAVIVAASIFDDALGNLLKQFLVPTPSSQDELFDGANAPISTFSAKIAFAHRLGLISSAFARNLHLIRRIRNEFAHNIHGGSFQDSAVKSRVMELYKSQKYVNGSDDTRLNPKGPRGDFLTVCLWMLWSINSDLERIQPLHEAAPEFGFNPKLSHDS
ncbi:transcriptional regulator [Marinobacter halotolerans]|uniref:transcriptional regulator n=1 Tax=Marinobacter halotolerans TaxID=1569211 RepID=UPI0012493456|nr:transcriptional regulator [Marinobacter halotolerans]